MKPRTESTPGPNPQSEHTPPGFYVPETLTPPWKDAAELMTQPIIAPPALVEGLIRRGERTVVGGASKSFKSWAALDLAISVSQGLPWLGRETSEARTLVVNLELPEWNVARRIADIAKARSLTLRPQSLAVWTVRGAARKAVDVFEAIERHGKDIGLVVIDPAYKLFAGRDENAAGEVAEFLSGFDRLTAGLGAAVVIPAHFSKGPQAGKESMDRISGSGVFARDPDSILTLTRHEVEDAFTFEATLRTFPPTEPFVVRWEFPLFHPEDSLDPSRLRQQTGRTRKFEDGALLGLLANGSRSYSEWQKLAEENLRMPKRTFDDYRKRMLRQNKVIRSATGDAYYLPQTQGCVL